MLAGGACVLTLLTLATSVHPLLISNGLRELIQNGTNSDVILQFPSVMNEVMSNPIFNMLPQGPLRTDTMVRMLMEATSRFQAPFLSALNQMGINASTFWITNKMYMPNLSPALVQRVATLPGLFTLRTVYWVHTMPHKRGQRSAHKRATAQWGVEKIGAPVVWDKSTRGEGVVLGMIDTGAYLQHEALKTNYRGGSGSWYDAIRGKTAPYDDNGHGTHAMGSAVGTANGIGVAPGAKWIACKALDENGSGTDATLSRCAQFMLKPAGNSNLKPQVVSNSWGGGQGQTYFNDEITAWRNAGIIPIFAIGNAGPNCRTANSPGDQPNVISVGATTKDDTMASFSSRGQSTSGGKLKPEVSAPGQTIYSAWPTSTTAYRNLDGTSMATPHVAGAVALMLSAYPNTTFDRIKGALQDTAFRPTNVAAKDIGCGDASSTNKYPNNAYGYGRIDVQKALSL